MMLILLCASVSWLRVGAVPIPSDPVTSAISTVVHACSSSDVRSLYEILRSCLFTIAACAYRAIHPNVPNPNASFLEQVKVTIKIVLCALIAPELMIYWAMRQRIGASVVAEKINALRPGLNWTQTHGQFAQMGGFGYKDDQKQPRILYPPILIKLLENGQIDSEDLQLTAKQINDRSKGDILSKGLVAFQTTWFVVECFARLQQGLPLLELEVVTLAFAALNVVTCGLWWNKPLNVHCPVYLRIQNSSLNSTIIPATSQSAHSALTTVNATKPGIKSYILLVWNWVIKQPFLAIAWPLGELVNDDDVEADTTHVTSFYGMKIPEEKDNLITLLTSVIGILFGGIHFLSWDSTFPTHTQALLWRISSTILVVQPLLVLLFDLCLMFSIYIPSELWKKKVGVLTDIFFVGFLGGTTPYIFARFSLLVISFLALRDLPLVIGGTEQRPGIIVGV